MSAREVLAREGNWARRAGRAFASTATIALLFVATQALSQPAPPPAGQPSPPPSPAAPAPAAPGKAAPGAPTVPAPSPTAPEAPGASPAPNPSPPAPAAPEQATGTPGLEPLIPRPREKVPGPPDPTPEQLEALRLLQEEAARYTADAKDYRRTLNRVIKHHYEEKRRTLLVALDRELDTETIGLKAARDQAIKELEIFIAKYEGPNAHPKSTPDAMFRLAALYEERAREVVEEAEIAPGVVPPDPDLSEAIALYKRIIVEFPKYDEIAAVYYYLGHAFTDTGLLAQGQQVWRSLVCQNHFPYPVPPDPQDPSIDSIQPLAQDHDQEWWFGWMGRHGEPIDQARAKGKEPNRADEEVFVDPFPDDCTMLAQNLRQGEDPRYVAEVWWRIGDYHFDEIDPAGGPFNLNRAESAYRHAMKSEKPPVYGVAMYKLAWTFYKQQRYESAVRQFVALLHYTDEQERLTGNPGADFRAEAYAYIAGSLTYVDFEGPGPDDPFIARNDIFDIETDAALIEQKMRVALDRVQDPELIPQDKKWTIEIYKALAFEFKEYNHFHNLVELDELILAKWPMHRDAPAVQNQIAEVYETLAAQTQGAEREKYQRLALDARGKLVNYVATPGNTPPWVEANKEDPEAIRAAERLVRGGLRRAAADHTNAGRAFIQQATSAGDDETARKAFESALEEYRLAARAWGGYLLQDENAEDAYESRFWLADAHTNIVTIQIALGRDPSEQEVDLARRFARDVRDSNEDDKYLQPAAIMVVRIAQQLVQRAYDRHRASGGRDGIEKREELKEVGDGDDASYVKEPVPAPLAEMIAAFDEYIARVPVEVEPNQEAPNHYRFAYLSGEIPFLYGQFAQARARLYPIYQQQCGKTEFGYLAWEKLFTMANKDNDVAESRKLAEATKKKSCAFDEAQKVAEGNMATEAIKRGYYQEAAEAYKTAEAMPEGPEKKKAWRKAAELYEAALKEAPDRNEAPEAAIYGAIAYKKIGEYDKAIAMYELFIDAYGSEKNLAALEKGDPTKGVKPNKTEYEKRVKNLKIAYDALAEAYVLFFDYQRAAQTYDKVAGIDRFDDQYQRTAAQNAVFLYANTGQRDKVEAAKQRFFKMNPSAQEKAEIEWLIASADLKQWDATGPNTGTNAQARLRALTAMEAYHRRFSGDRAADKFSVQAAYWASRLHRANQAARGAEEWCDKTVGSFDSYKASAGKDDKGNNRAIGGVEGDMAAECAYRKLDAEIVKNHDYDSGHHRFKGVITDVRDQFKRCVEDNAKKYFDRLQEVITRFESYKWTVAARARQGSLYDSCRTGLYNAREPELKLYTAQEEKLLQQLDDLCVNQGSDDACTKHDTFTAKRRMDWRQSRDQDLGAADKVMVRGYVEAIQWGKHWKVRVDATDHAIARLAFYTEIIGDQKLRELSDGIKDRPTKDSPAFVYRDGMFMRMRRGMTTKVPAEVLPSPLPAIPQP